MYRWLRNTHLFTGLFSALFVLMYGVSSVQMAHNNWFDIRPTVTESTVAVEPSSDARAVARQLMDRHGTAGEIQQINQKGDRFAFRIVRPGTMYDVEGARGAAEVKVKTSTAPLLGMLNRLHHISGYWREYQVMNAWGVVLGLVSLGLIVLGATGIYLWFKLNGERVIGAILLAVSLGYSLTLMVLIRLA
jgi:hypothetical protein